MAKAEKQAVPAVGNKAILAEVTLIDAIKQIESKLAYQPESVRFAQLADAYLDMGQYDQAITILTDGLQKFPYYDTARLILAKAYYRRGEKKQAQEYIREFLQSHPAHVAAHKLLGDLALEEDDVVSAVKKYRVALRFDPINKVLIQSLVDLKDQYQKLKASRSEEEDEDGVRPVVRKPVSSAERPAPTAETPVAKAQPSFEPPAEKEELKMPTEMVEDLIVKEMTKKKAVPVAEVVKPEPLAEPVLEEKRDELISDSASEVPTTVKQTAAETSDVDEALKASAAWIDSEDVLY
ncbi:MAG TPA: tetratricopeptide repeat protein, partial [bacterium]|nr:tetratricopeptide repeat protein [bacterium]